MQAKANLFGTLLVLLVVLLVAGAVALFGLGLRTAEPQTTPSTTSYAVQDLGTLGGSSSYARGINDSGQVVGYSLLSDGAQHAFLYDSTKGMKDLNDLIPADSGGTIYDATAINSDGKIAATDFKPFGTDPAVCQFENYSGGWVYAAVLTPATTATYEVQDLGTVGGDWSEATGINDSGKVVGYSMTSGCFQDAFLYDASATPKMQDLGTLGGPYSEATGINDPGQVVGYSSRDYQSCSHDCWRAFLYDERATPKMQELGTLGGSSRALDINKYGQAVGYSYVSGAGDRAFLKESGKPMKDLNDLIPPASGWTIYEATAINSNGKIAATGDKAGVGRHALLLTPTSDSPPPPDSTNPDTTNPDTTNPDTTNPDITIAAPENLTATAGGTRKQPQISLKWTDRSDNEDNFVVERFQDSDSTWKVLTSSLAANTTSYTDKTGLSAGKRYTYRVKATKGAASSGYSNEASATTIK